MNTLRKSMEILTSKKGSDVEIMWSKVADFSEQEKEQVIADLEELVEEYPIANKDPHYIEFLTRYGGYSYFSDDFDLSIYGFDDHVCDHLTKGDAEMLDERGFIPIVIFHYKVEDEYNTISFSLDAEENQRGIYKSFLDSTTESDYVLYCKDFQELLHLLATEDWMGVFRKEKSSL